MQKHSKVSESAQGLQGSLEAWLAIWGSSAASISLLLFLTLLEA